MSENEKSLLDLKIDIIFKQVFHSECKESKEAMRGLLTAILNKEIHHVEVLPNEIAGVLKNEKKIRMDSVCIFNNGERANVEMQVSKTRDDLTARAIYYLTRIFQSQEMEGLDYDDLEKAYQIMVIDYTMYDDDKYVHHFVMKDENNIIFNSLLHIFIIELKKLDAFKDVKKMSLVEKWMFIIKYWNDATKQDIIKVIKDDVEEIAMVEKRIKRLSENEIQALRDVMDEMHRIEDGHEEEAYQRMIKNQLRDSVVKEVREELKDSVVEEVRKELKDSVVEEVRKELKGSVVEEVREELKGSVVEEVREELKDSVVEEVREELKNSVTKEVQDKIFIKLSKELGISVEDLKEKIK